MMNWILAGLFSILLFDPAYSLVYREKTGDVVIYSALWTTNAGNIIKVYYTNSTESYEVECKEGYDVISLKYANFEKKISFVARRHGNVIMINGKSNNVTVQKELKIDNSPWYQFMELAFSDLVKNDNYGKEFWIIRISDISSFKMVVNKEKAEKITIDDKSYDSVKLKVTLTGFLSKFWSANYWFSVSDYIFLKYSGKRGQGVPVTIVELISD